MATYKIEGYKVNLKNTYQHDGYGKCIIQYSLVSPDGDVIFSGKDFHPSPLHAPTGKNAAMSLLGFLTLRPGDTDQEYFDNYTPEQMDWCNSDDCEILQLAVYDYENGEYK